MKKNSSIVIGLIVVVVIVGGAFALFHKSHKASTTTNTSTQTQTSAVNNAVLVTKTDSSLGQYLAEPSGMPLYTYGADAAGVSNCSGSCLASWPAYQDKGSTTGLPSGVGTIKRSDNGETQFTYNGMPLYTFVGDSTGRVTGNGVSNFTLAKPAATSTSASSSTDNQPASSSTSTTSPSSSNSSSSSNSYSNPY